MTQNFLLILINKRKNDSVKVQQVLTEWGCLIKTRLGLHADTLENCSEVGNIFIELVGDADKHKELAALLDKMSGVTAKLVEMHVD